MLFYVVNIYLQVFGCLKNVTFKGHNFAVSLEEVSSSVVCFTGSALSPSFFIHFSLLYHFCKHIFAITQHISDTLLILCYQVGPIASLKPAKIQPD